MPTIMRLSSNPSFTHCLPQHVIRTILVTSPSLLLCNSMVNAQEEAATMSGLPETYCSFCEACDSLFVLAWVLAVHELAK